MEAPGQARIPDLCIPFFLLHEWSHELCTDNSASHLGHSLLKGILLCGGL